MSAAAEPIELPFGYPTEPVVVRVCVDCREPKEIGEFRVVKGSPLRPLPYCRPCERGRGRRRYAANVEKERERLRRYRWRGENPEKGREYARRYRAENAARTDAQIEADRWVAHPDGVKVCRSCRQALPFEEFTVDRATRSGLLMDCRACAVAKKRAPLEALVAALFGEDCDAWRCYVCGGPYEEIEHLWPTSRLGENRPSNVLPACRDCNRGRDGKHDRDPREWLLTRMSPEDAWALLAERLPASLLLTA